MEYFEPIYKLKIKLDLLEEKLIKTKYFQKLRHIFHSGFRAFVSPLRHTRFEHSLGLLSLTKYFNLPREIQLAALLHDIGHIAFSHSAERAFGEGIHHELTRNIIKKKMGKILKSFGFDPQRIIDSINKWPLESEKGIMNLDHLESFFRDTYYLGIQKISPAELIKKIELKNFGIIAKEKAAAKEIMRLCIEDNKNLLSDQSLVANCLGLKLFKIAKKLREIDLESLEKETEYEVISRMLNSKNKRLKRLVFDILFNLGSYKAIEVKKSDYKCKLYLETIFYKGRKFNEIDSSVKKEFQKLKKREGYYKVIKIKNLG